MGFFKNKLSSGLKFIKVLKSNMSCYIGKFGKIGI